MRPARNETTGRVDPSATFAWQAFPRLRPELRAYAAEVERADDARRDAARMRRLLAVTIANEAVRLVKGRHLSPKLALTNCALSADKLRYAYQRDHGGELPAKSTIQGHLRALFPYHAGYLPGRWDHGRQIMLSPGHTYDLRVLALTLGKHGRLLVQHLRSYLPTYYTHNRFSGSNRIRPTSDRERMKRRARGALDWAILAAEGRRNAVGFRLAALCRDIGLDPLEVERVMEDYQSAVEWTGTHPYTYREAMATVRSAFRRATRGGLACPSVAY